MYLLQAAAQAAAPVIQSPWDWVVTHLPLVGWPTVIICAVKIAWHIRGFLNDVKARAIAAESQVRTPSQSSNTELKETLEGQVNAQRELAQSVHQLAEAMHHQSDLHSEQLGLIREMSSEQKVLASNQMVIMTGFQRVVEQLIAAVAEDK